MTDGDGTRRQVGVRFYPGLVERLDAWLADINRRRRVPLNRTDLINGVLDWACETRPDFEQRLPEPEKRVKKGTK